MDPIDSLGLFWLPGSEDDQLAGRLQFDLISGITLSLVGSFNDAIEDNGDPIVRIFGWIGSDPVTLDRCYSRGTNLRSPGMDEARYYANRMFIGYHIESTDQCFQSANARFSHTGTWLNRSGIDVASNHSGNGNEQSVYTAKYTPVPEIEHPFSRGIIKIGHAWRATGDPTDGVEIKQWPTFTLDYDKPRPLKEVNTDVRNIQNLITLCVDTP